MKNAKSILAALLALSMLFSLVACGEKEPVADNQEPPVSESVVEPDKEPEKEPEQVVEEPAASIAGTYTFDYTDPYGDISTVTVVLTDEEGFTLTTEGSMGENSFTGKKWTDNGDGTFKTGALNGRLVVDWADATGSVNWTINGTSITPVGYTVPTEFLSKGAPDPSIGGEAVGIYTYGFANSYGSIVPYILWVNGDNTYTIYMNNSFKGLATYSGEGWTIDSNGVIALAPFTLPEGRPDGDWFVEGDDGFSSSWQLHADGTCEPVGCPRVEIDISTLPEEIYPANAQYVGVYLFAYVNNFGSAVPYILWLNADGTATIYCNNSFKGLLTYTVEDWTVNDDGTVSLGNTTAESGVPDGAWFSKDDSHVSTWVVNEDGTCAPVGYETAAVAVNGAEQPESVYPRYITGA